MSYFKSLLTENCGLPLWVKTKNQILAISNPIETSSILYQTDLKNSSKSQKSCFLLNGSSLYHVKGNCHWQEQRTWEVIGEMKLDWVLVFFKNQPDSSQPDLKDSKPAFRHHLPTEGNRPSIMLRHLDIPAEPPTTSHIVANKVRISGKRSMFQASVCNQGLPFVSPCFKLSTLGSRDCKNQMNSLAVSQPTLQKYEITFVKNHETCTLYSKTPVTFEKWMLALSSKCIQTNVLEKFRFEEPLSQNWTSTIYKAFDIVNSRYVSLKVIDKQKISCEQDKNNLSEKIKVLRILSEHPSFPSLYEIHENEKSVYLSMEFIQGEKLKNTRRILNERQIIEVTQQLTAAAWFFSNKNIKVHFLNSENVMFLFPESCLGDLKIKIVGLEKNKRFLQNKSVDSLEFPTSYFAPELFSKKQQKPDFSSKCVVFSIGILLYELISRRTDFKGTPNRHSVQLTVNGKIDSQNPLFLAISEKSKLISAQVNPENDNLQSRAPTEC